MYIQYERSHDDSLAVKICPFDAQAPYVEITLLAYPADDGTQCWLPPEVRRLHSAHSGQREAAALKEATDVAVDLVALLQTAPDPEQALKAVPRYRIPEAA